jgi:glycosyltransferase involved in cell wall biosynthesis
VFPWFVAARVRRTVKAWRPHVVDASTGDAWLWARLRRRRRADAPLLVTRSHGLEHVNHEQRVREARAGNVKLSWRYPLYYGGLRLWEVAASLRGADAVFLLNNEDRSFATAHLGVAPERAHVVRNGIPRTFLGQPRPVAADGEPRLAQVGQYTLGKGVRYGATALTEVLRGHSDMRISFLGTACPRDAVLRDFPTELHDRIEVVPSYSRDDLPRLLEGHELTLFPTLYDGFGKTLLEAMACGLAPVTTLVAGPREVVRDGIDGLLVPPADANALVTAIERLLADPDLRLRLRTGAWETAQRFSWESAAQQRLALYEAELERVRGNGQASEGWVACAS